MQTAGRDGTDPDLTRVIIQRRVKALNGDDPQSFGDYQLMWRIAEGNRDTDKFVATHTEQDLVLVKALHAGAAPEARLAFSKEVADAQRVYSPRIARMLNLGEAQGRLFSVQQFAPGKPLSELLAERPDHRLTAPEALELAVQVLEALRDVRDAGVVHSDVKPANLICGNRDTILVDFGIAQLPGVRPRQMMGTLLYVSPEQARLEALQWTSDLYAWGITIAEASTGRHPFDPHRELVDSEYAAALISGVRPRLDGLPFELQEAVAGALCFQPRDRPSLERVLGMLGRQVAVSTSSLPHIGPAEEFDLVEEVYPADEVPVRVAAVVARAPGLPMTVGTGALRADWHTISRGLWEGALERLGADSSVVVGFLLALTCLAVFTAVLLSTVGGWLT
jgi:serine/threonine protein kinase